MNKQTNALFLILVLLMSILLAACQTGQLEVAADEVELINANTAVNMADRIHFQDRVMGGEGLATEGNEVAGSGAEMAARIQFQDKLWQQSNSEAAGKQPGTYAVLTLADRIHFQDRLWGERPLGKNGLSLADRIHFQDQLWENQR